MPVQRFACTQCGKCCNCPPEVQLSEAAALADVFVFRLMFRLYWLPRKPSDELRLTARDRNAPAQFYERKRLLSAYAARQYPAKIRRAGEIVEYTKYLMISALALDTRPGACAALNGTRCGIYDRRPLSCRSVPFHYSHAESAAEASLKSFVQTAGYKCDTGETAPVVMEDGRIVVAEARTARAQALAVADRDRRWREAIARRTTRLSEAAPSLPTIDEIEANAHVGVITTSMLAAWQIAAGLGVIGPDELKRLVELQRRVIEQELASGSCSPDVRQTLAEMRSQYDRAIAVGSEGPPVSHAV